MAGKRPLRRGNRHLVDDGSLPDGRSQISDDTDRLIEIPPNDGEELDLFFDLVCDLRFERPAPGSQLEGRYDLADGLPIALDAPYGSQGPMLFRFGDMLSLLFDWSTVQSGMRISDPDYLLFDYTRMMMAFRLFRPYPRSIEMIGLGGGSLAKACYRCLPDCDITVIEIDPSVIALREQFHVPADDGRFRVIEGDGVNYVARAKGRPDVILLDGFDSRGLPGALSEKSFYDACRDRLGSDGLLVANLCDNNAAFAVLQRRIAASFDGRVIGVPAERHGNRIVFASANTCFPPSLASLKRARAAVALDVVDYALKARRIEPAIRRWIRRMAPSSKAAQTGT